MEAFDSDDNPESITTPSDEENEEITSYSSYLSTTSAEEELQPSQPEKFITTVPNIKKEQLTSKMETWKEKMRAMEERLRALEEEFNKADFETTQLRIKELYKDNSSLKNIDELLRKVRAERERQKIISDKSIKERNIRESLNLSNELILQNLDSISPNHSPSKTTTEKKQTPKIINLGKSKSMEVQSPSIQVSPISKESIFSTLQSESPNRYAYIMEKKKYLKRLEESKNRSKKEKTEKDEEKDELRSPVTQSPDSTGSRDEDLSEGKFTKSVDVSYSESPSKRDASTDTPNLSHEDYIQQKIENISIQDIIQQLDEETEKIKSLSPNHHIEEMESISPHHEISPIKKRVSTPSYNRWTSLGEARSDGTYPEAEEYNPNYGFWTPPATRSKSVASQRRKTASTSPKVRYLLRNKSKKVEAVVPYSDVRHLQQDTQGMYNHSTIEWYMNLCGDKYSRHPNKKTKEVKWVGYESNFVKRK